MSSKDKLVEILQRNGDMSVEQSQSYAYEIRRLDQKHNIMTHLSTFLLGAFLALACMQLYSAFWADIGTVGRANISNILAELAMRGYDTEKVEKRMLTIAGVNTIYDIRSGQYDAAINYLLMLRGHAPDKSLVGSAAS